MDERTGSHSRRPTWLNRFLLSWNAVRKLMEMGQATKDEYKKLTRHGWDGGPRDKGHWNGSGASVAFASVLAGIVCSRVSCATTKIGSLGREVLCTAEDNQVGNHLGKKDTHKSMGSNGIQGCWSNWQMTQPTCGLLLLEKVLRPWEVSSNWEKKKSKCHSHMQKKKKSKENLGKYRLVSLISSPVKTMKHVCMSRHIKIK